MIGRYDWQILAIEGAEVTNRQSPLSRSGQRLTWDSLGNSRWDLRTPLVLLIISRSRLLDIKVPLVRTRNMRRVSLPVLVALFRNLSLALFSYRSSPLEPGHIPPKHFHNHPVDRHQYPIPPRQGHRRIRTPPQ
jgi:hypothetical protein